MSKRAPEKPAYWARAKRELALSDPVIDAIIRAHPRAALESRGEAFATLARSIVGQQISVKAAQSVWNRFAEAVEEVRPAPVRVMHVDALRACGLSARKAEYLKDLADGFHEGRLQPARWTSMPDEDVILELVQVRGVGRWTAEMFLMFNLLRPDVLPVADLGLRRAVSLAYRNGRSVSAASLARIAARWRPWRSVATWYLWRSLDPVPVEY